MKVLFKSMVLLFAVVLITACKDPQTNKEDFDRSPMLINLADNIIIPNYQDLQTKLVDFSAKISALNLNPNATTLADARSSWLEACKQWQHCKVFELGPAASIALRNSMNAYPVDTALINSNISSGNYTLGAVSNITAIGFQAYDYLLYDGTDADVINRISNSANYKQYLVDLVVKMQTDIDYVTNEWTNSYRSTFVSSTGSASGSSTNDLYNEMTFDLELIKNAKFGIPLGKDILDVARPTYVEAYYSEESMTLAIENMKSIENVFLGKSMSGTDGVGFDEYLDHCEAKRGSEYLSTVIKNQFTILYADMAAIPNPLSGALVSNYSQVNDLFFTIKTQVLYIKTDMSSALGLIIEFVDNDGD
jgi:predicted lipoprotein